MGTTSVCVYAVRMIVSALGLIAALTTAHTGPHVIVEQGDVGGTTETFEESDFIGVTKTIDVFRGVPFAEPPVGPLRFQPPVPKQPWDGSYNATYFRSACIQDPSTVFGSPMSEDCLHLNIYAPNPRPTDAAVMVWIHGGGYASGSAVLAGYFGQPLVAVGDVIVVTINYRLNVFGFMTTGDDALPGNLGLHDQVLALQWINQNIGAFGGDSGRITVFGESAGAASVGLLTLSPKATGLFSQVILQSGTALTPWAFTEYSEPLRRQAFQIGEALGCKDPDSAALVNCLREKNATALYTAVPPETFRSIAVVDKIILEDTPANLYATGRYSRAKILLGTTAEEGSLFVYINPLFSEYATGDDPPPISREVFNQLLSEDLYVLFGGPNEQLADAIKMRYVDWSQADYSDADYFRSRVDLTTDFIYACGADQVARIHAHAGDDVFMYQMNRVPSVSYFALAGVGPGWLGAGHAEDLPYVFGVPFIPDFGYVVDRISDEDKAFSVKFMEFWTNFAKTGNPGLKTPNSQPASDRDFWPRFTIPELEYKVLDLNLTTSRALKSDECQFWNTFVPQLLTMLADLDVAEREWRQSFYTWKYTDMEDWKEHFDRYQATVMN